MAYAVLQTSLTPPEPERLVRAFAALDRLTSLDAHAMARDAFGILVKGLSMAEALRLVQALDSQGILAEAVEEKEVPTLPPLKRLNRAEVRPEAFVAYDLVGRESAIEWSHVVMVAAGEVLRSEFKHLVEEHQRFLVGWPMALGSGMPIMVETVRAEHKDREERVYRLILELFLDIAPGRYHISAERFSFECLGERLSPRRAENFANFVRDCLARVPGAILNLGAQTLGRQKPAMVRYPSRHSFEEELVWLLWRHLVWPRRRGGGG